MKCSLYLQVRCSVACLAFIFPGLVQAANSAVTATVKGRAPVASSVSFSAPSAIDGLIKKSEVATSSYTFSDADGDAESGTSFQWLRAGADIASATASTYTTVQDDVNANLTVKITPQTDPALTDPASGDPVTSAARHVVFMDATKWSTPTTVQRNWSQASSYCTSLGGGYRLPTKDELVALYIDATRAAAVYPNEGYVGNTDMCDLYNWPMSNKCGGGNDVSWLSYWSSTADTPGRHFNVGMDFGNHYSYADDRLFLVACVK